MEIHYCKQWSRYRKRPHEPFTDAQAKRAYDNSKLFTALLGSAAHPYCFLEFSARRSVVVEFLDESLTTYQWYSFQEKRRNKFFCLASDGTGISACWG